MESKSETAHAAGAFDVRRFIGTLLGIYGVVLVLDGLFGMSEQELAKADDVNVNLWAGVGLVVACLVFLVWARLRPVIVPAHHEEDANDRPSAGH